MSSHFEICPTSGNSRATSIVISSSSDKHLLTYLLILLVIIIAETSFIFPVAVVGGPTFCCQCPQQMNKICTLETTIFEA